MPHSFPFSDFPSATCYIVPKATATSKQLKRLGKAIGEWVHNLDVSIKIEHGTDDLHQGELPTPKSIHWTKKDSGFEQFHVEMEELAKVSSNRGVYVKMYSLVPSYMATLDRDNLIEQLRECLPANAVDDVLIDGVSWKEEA